MSQPDWMKTEQDRAESLQETGQTSNHTAPKLVKLTKEPERIQKAFYIQAKFADAFADLAHEQKKQGGKRAPALAEEAILLLLKKYGADTKGL